MDNKNCVQCKKENSSYKCPQCKASYCSSQCNKTHRAVCLQKNPVVPLPTTLATATEVTKGTEVTTIKKKCSNNNIDSNETLLLKEDKKHSLDNSSELKTMLQSKKLQDDIKSIDSLQDDTARQNALRKKRKENPEFDDFIKKLLRVIE